MRKDSIKSVLLVSSSPPEAGRINHRHARDPCVRPGTNTGDALCKVLKGIRNFKWQLLPSLKFLINQNAPIQLIPNHQSFWVKLSTLKIFFATLSHNPLIILISVYKCSCFARKLKPSETPAETRQIWILPRHRVLESKPWETRSTLRALWKDWRVFATKPLLIKNHGWMMMGRWFGQNSEFASQNLCFHKHLRPQWELSLFPIWFLSWLKLIEMHFAILNMSRTSTNVRCAVKLALGSLAWTFFCCCCTLWNVACVFLWSEVITGTMLGTWLTYLQFVLDGLAVQWHHS